MSPIFVILKSCDNPGAVPYYYLEEALNLKGSFSTWGNGRQSGLIQGLGRKFQFLDSKDP